MVPEFISRDGTEEMTGELEELTCWENTRAMALCFHRLGYRNVIISDIDDLRTADIPVEFKQLPLPDAEAGVQRSGAAPHSNAGQAQ